jgi:methionyl-tRNA formyltransferase
VRIVFFGTPDFAVPSLRALTGEGFAIEAVVTQPDKSRNRSRSKVLAPPIKEVAIAENIPVLQPDNPNTPEFLEIIRGYQPDIGVVVAYGHILKKELLDLPKYGMINVHASLLPQLRGAAPIQRAICDGLEKTGITIMQMDSGMDSGPILHQVETEIANDETCGELAVNLAEIGALALVEALSYMTAGHLTPREQDASLATYAPKLDRETARIDWTHSAEQVACKIRSMDPNPGAWSMIQGKAVKLFGPTVLPGGSDQTPGTVMSPDQRKLIVATTAGMVCIEQVQPEGKKRMSAADWCCGAGPAVGDRFE